MEYYNFGRDEQETIINIDYFSRKISLYTNRIAVMRKLQRTLGNPTKYDTIEGKTCSVEYVRDLTSLDGRKLLSRPLLLGSFAHSKPNNTEEESDE